VLVPTGDRLTVALIRNGWCVAAADSVVCATRLARHWRVRLSCSESSHTFP
jgi:hypothetical protein